MIWLVPFLIITAFYASIILFVGFLSTLNKEMMKEIYLFYGLTLLISYCIYLIVVIQKG